MDNKRRRIRKIHRSLVLALGIGAIVLGLVDLIAGHILGQKLIATIQRHANVHLTLDQVAYRPPYGIVVWGFHLSTASVDGPDQDLLDIDEVKLSLAEFPRHGRPLLIEGLDIRQPVLHITRGAGLPGQGEQIIKPENNPVEPENGRKISDLLHLRNLSIKNAQVMLKDINHPDDPATIWGGVDVNIATTRQGPSDYSFKIDARDGELLDLKGTGTFDVDGPWLKLDQFSLSSQLKHEQPPAQIPPDVREIVENYAIDGRLKMDGSAQLARAGDGGTHFEFTSRLDEASARIPNTNAKLNDLHLTIRTTGAGSEVVSEISDFSAVSGSAALFLKENAGVNFDLRDRRWAIEHINGALKLDGNNLPIQPGDITARGIVDFTAAAHGGPGLSGAQVEALLYPQELAFTCARWAAPLSGMTGGPIRVLGSAMEIQNLTGSFGPDVVTIKTARLALPLVRDHIMQWSDISGSIVFNPPSPQYPPPVGDILASLRPGGEYDFAGSITNDPSAAPPRAKVDMDMLISSDHGRMMFTDQNIAVTEIKGDTELFSDHLQITRLEANALGGKLAGQGTVGTRRPSPYSGEMKADGLQLAEIAKLLHAHSGKTVHLDGLGRMKMSFNGFGRRDGTPALDQFQAKGQAEIDHGEFWEFPVLSSIVDKTKVSRKALTVGQAAAMFHVTDKTVHLDDAAVNAPILGLSGKGDVTFAGELNLEIVVAPLADWREGFRRTGIPLVSDLAGDVFGKVQDFLNTATENLLYEFRATGNASDPKIETVPAPIFTRGSATIFGNMLGQDEKKNSPIDLLKGTAAATQK